jgi:hypothetical protein
VFPAAPRARTLPARRHGGGPPFFCFLLRYLAAPTRRCTSRTSRNAANHLADSRRFLFALRLGPGAFVRACAPLRHGAFLRWSRCSFSCSRMLYHHPGHHPRADRLDDKVLRNSRHCSRASGITRKRCPAWCRLRGNGRRPFRRPVLAARRASAAPRASASNCRVSEGTDWPT